MKNFNVFFISYLFLIIGLFFYSYTQVDLNLTLSQFSIWQVIQKTFQYIGWFNRPLSTVLYIVLLVLLTAGYWFILQLVKKGSVTVKQFWQLVIPMGIILLFSYNAFSYDLFNYMFDARIVTLHHQDPYGYKALDFPQDPWVNFMRWTHRTYPYGWTWLGLTVPLSFIGMQFFLPTLFLFKALMTACYFGAIYFIGKILEKLSPKDKLFGMTLFAFSPLVIIESLVSAHNDIVMMFFALFGIYSLITKRYILAALVLIVSAHIKFINDPLPDILHQLIPVAMAGGVALFWWMNKKGKEINWNFVLLGMSAVMLIAVFLGAQRTELQPWYLLWVLPFASLLPKKKFYIPLTVISLGLLLHYVPFLYTGNWDPPIPTIKTALTVGSIVLGLLAFLAFAKRK